MKRRNIPETRGIKQLNPYGRKLVAEDLRRLKHVRPDQYRTFRRHWAALKSLRGNETWLRPYGPENEPKYFKDLTRKRMTTSLSVSPSTSDINVGFLKRRGKGPTSIKRVQRFARSAIKYADRKQLSIEQFPHYMSSKPLRGDEYNRRNTALARWYRRLGFQVTSKSGSMTRHPRR